MSAVAEKRILELSSYRTPQGGAGKTSTSIEIPEELEILEGTSQPKEGQHCFRVLTVRDGDKRVVWDSGSLREISGAKKMFLGLVKQGLVPYRVGAGGKPGAEVMSEFDPAAEEVVFLPAKMVGGG